MLNFFQFIRNWNVRSSSVFEMLKVYCCEGSLSVGIEKILLSILPGGRAAIPVLAPISRNVREAPPSASRTLMMTGLLVALVLLPADVSAQGRPSTAPKVLSGHVELDMEPVFRIRETRRAYPHTTPVKATPKSTHGIIGLDMLIKSSEYPLVQSVFPGTPARRVGMLPGDAIIAVNGVQTIGKSRTAVDQMISDRPGDVVNMTVFRDGELRSVRLTVMAAEDLAAHVRENFGLEGIAPFGN